jgi:beta-galactosidase
MLDKLAAGNQNLAMKMYPLLFALGASALAFVSTLYAREDTLLDSGWRFKQQDVAGAESIDFSDADWTAVAIPHNWGFEQAQLGRPFYQGPGWYRLELKSVTPKAGRRYFIRFEAASTVGDVYLNGKKIGQHRGAFGAFCFEVTTNLSASGKNLLAVRVSNAPQPDVAPLAGDFSVYGGLYRPVHLIETSEQNIALTDHGSTGVAWLETSVSAKEAVLDVTAQISNPARSRQSLVCTARVVDTNGMEVARTEKSFTLPGNVTAPVSIRVTVPDPHLWNGRKDPHLYRAVFELRSQGTVVDSVEQPLGLRFYSVDPEKGFFLNGQPYHLHGVDRHQERFGKGWAISQADQDEDIQLMSEMGCTVVRCAHYQHSDYFYSLCDKVGILVWAELPLVNEVRNSAEFSETTRNQWLDLIRQNINHPSIFVWSMFNEMAASRGDPHRLLEDLSAMEHGEDPTRPTIGASNHGELDQMNRIPDVLGRNFYPGWYSGRKEDFGSLLDQARNSSRAGGFCVSEYGAGANVNQHEDNPKQPAAGGQWHPEEWQALLHEAAWPAMKARPFVWGTFVWVMFDFAVSTRHEGGVQGRNDKGLVTADRTIRKDAFFYYKANWSDEPVLYLTSRRYTERTNAVTDVKLYSNAPEVELFVNNVTQGKRADGVNGVFIWNQVKLAAGPAGNQIEARAQRNGHALTDHCVWTLKPGGPE